MYFSGNVDANKIKTGLFISEQTQLASYKKTLEQQNFSIVCEAITGGNTGFLSKLDVSDIASLDAVIVDLKGQENPLAYLGDICARFSRECVVIAVGSEMKDISTTSELVEFYRKLRFLGVSDYFVEPAPVEEIIKSLLIALQLGTGTCSHQGTLVAVHGTHGGIGAGLISAGLGVLLSQEHARASVIVDTDMLSPSVGSYLGSSKAGNLKVLLQSGTRLDQTLIRQGLFSILPQLAFLDGFEDLNQIDDLDVSRIENLFNLLGIDYRYQIWRSSGNKKIRSQVLSNADIVLLVVTGSLSCAKIGQSTLRWLEEQKFTGRILTVYNNVAPTTSIPLAHMEKVLGVKVDHEIPYNKKVDEDILKNTPLNSKNHALYKDLSKICNNLLGVRVEEKTGLARFLK